MNIVLCGNHRSATRRSYGILIAALETLVCLDSKVARIAGWSRSTIELMVRVMDASL